MRQFYAGDESRLCTRLPPNLTASKVRVREPLFRVPPCKEVVLAMSKQVLYDDGLVTLDVAGLTIRRYYFPLGTSKRIPYARIKGVQEWRMGLLTGKGRLWGS